MDSRCHAFNGVSTTATKRWVFPPQYQLHGRMCVCANTAHVCDARVQKFWVIQQVSAVGLMSDRPSSSAVCGVRLNIKRRSLAKVLMYIGTYTWRIYMLHCVSFSN